PGLLGVLFREFTYSLAGAVLISGIVALTLSPMMSARLLRPSSQQNRYSIWLHRFIGTLQQKYKSALNFMLRKRLWVVLGLLLVGALGGVVYKFMSSELAPQEDMGQMYIAIAGPRTASFQYTDQYTRQLEAAY